MRRLLVILLTFGIASLVAGRATFVSSVPNIDALVANDAETRNACQTCHESMDPSSNNALNLFGQQVQANLTNGAPDWSKIFSLDADNDGFTNGQELGDAGGVWRVGSSRTTNTAYITHPARASSAPPQSVQNQVNPTAWGVIKTLFH